LKAEYLHTHVWAWDGKEGGACWYAGSVVPTRRRTMYYPTPKRVFDLVKDFEASQPQNRLGL